jgi:hypothetical protein
VVGDPDGDGVALDGTGLDGDVVAGLAGFGAMPALDELGCATAGRTGFGSAEVLADFNCAAGVAGLLAPEF